MAAVGIKKWELDFPHKFVKPEQVEEGGWMQFFRHADPALKDGFCARDDVVDAFIWLVVDAYRGDDTLEIAEVVMRDTQRLRMEEGDELSVIKEHFKVTKNIKDFVTVATVNAFAKENKLNKRSLHSRLEKMGAVKEKDVCVDGVRHGMGFRRLAIDFSGVSE